MGLTIYLGYELYERSQDYEWDGGSSSGTSSNRVESLETLSFPDVVDLSRHDGKSLRVKLIGKNSTQVQFERLSDGQIFLFSIEDLSAESRNLLERYRAEGLKNADAHFRKGELSLEDAYIEQLREKIAEINEELNEIQALTFKSVSKTERRTLMRKAEKLKAERHELQRKIDERI